MERVTDEKGGELVKTFYTIIMNMEMREWEVENSEPKKLSFGESG